MVEVIVEYDYQAKEPDELTIKKGDIIKDVIKKQGGWWEGVLNDKKGMFPDNFVRCIDNDSVVLRNKKDVSRIRKCRVIFSYNQDHEDELNLKVGDIIDIIGEEEEGWWRGLLNGKEGVFPSNFVEEIVTHQPKPKPTLREDLNDKNVTEGNVPMLPAKPVKQLCEVRYPYIAQNEDELTINEGDLITLLSKEVADPGWWKGELNGKIGVFPDNFVVLLSNSDDKTAKDDKKQLSRIITYTGAIKPSSIASQRKSLEIKSLEHKSPVEIKTNRKSVEAKSDKPSPEAKTTPPVPGKKPIISLKKSPSSSGSGIFSEIRKKLVDVVDGATGSKPKADTPVEQHKDNSGENVFDQVERRPLLQDVRATRAKAPGRRPPSTVHKDDESGTVLNGDAEHVTSEAESNRPSSPSEPDAAEIRPKLREWEKHKAPWLEEMKMNQAKRTSTSPGPPEQKLKLTSTPEPEESKSAKNSPVEKEISPIDMSKSMSSLSSKLKTPPNELEKSPISKIKPALPPHSSSWITSNVSSLKELKEPSTVKSKMIPSTPKSAAPIKPERNHNEKENKQEKDEELVNSNLVTQKQYNDLLERVQNLENIIEKQNQAIEDLRSKIVIERDMRMMLQEKLSQNVQV